jgi:hypothetical protein
MMTDALPGYNLLLDGILIFVNVITPIVGILFIFKAFEYIKTRQLKAEQKREEERQRLLENVRRVRMENLERELARNRFPRYYRAMSGNIAVRSYATTFDSSLLGPTRQTPVGAVMAEETLGTGAEAGAAVYPEWGTYNNVSESGIDDGDGDDGRSSRSGSVESRHHAFFQLPSFGL